MHQYQELRFMKSRDERGHMDAIVWRAKSGDDEARRQLQERFTPLFDKWIQIAAQGLPRAVRVASQTEARRIFELLLLEFEPERGVPFWSYVRYMLRRRILNYVRQERLRLYHVGLQSASRTGRRPRGKAAATRAA
jgi:hypothetical protein